MGYNMGIRRAFIVRTKDPLRKGKVSYNPGFGIIYYVPIVRVVYQ